MLMHYLTTVLVALLAAVVLIFAHVFAKKKYAIVSKCISLVFAALFLVAYLWADDALRGVLALASLEGVKYLGTAGSAILVWLTIASGIFLCLYGFFRERCPSMNVLTVLPALVFLLDTLFLNDFVAAIVGSGLDELSVRSVLLAAEVGVGLGYSVFAFATTVKTFKRYVKSLGWLALGLAGMIACSMPNYALQLFFNPYRYAFTAIDLNYYHRLLMYPAFVLPIALYFVLSGKDAYTKRCALLYYALAELWHFMGSQKFGMIWGLSNVGSLPLHLCNTACYITPICLTFKFKRLFYFTYFINVLGAFFALTMPSYSTEGLSGTVLVYDTLRFYRSHYQAFFMPLLVVGLGVFERPRLRQYIWSMVGFLIYYVLMLVLNGWFTNYDASVDYFFINSDFIADKLGSWAERLRDIVWSFEINGLKFTYYPLYQFLYFLVYCLLALGMWFIYEVAYKSISGWLDLTARRKAIRMDYLATQAAMPHEGGAPMNETAETLSIQGFTKRYARSSVYAAKDVNLDVKDGEIIGFLGPNGAGKSTIIKSLVGIQPITAGKIYVCGYDVEKQSVQAKLNIGFVPDHYALYEKLTAREYVNYIADLYNVNQADRDERMQRYIEIFELQKKVDEPISTYSHGMKQKVAIMAALIHNPKVWILDEPLTGLDPNSIFQVKECMKQHAAAGNVVFFSSHLIDVVERICTRIAIIRKGQLQCVRDVADIEADGTTLEEFYMNVINTGTVEAIPYTGKIEASEA